METWRTHSLHLNAEQKLKSKPSIGLMTSCDSASRPGATSALGLIRSVPPVLLVMRGTRTHKRAPFKRRCQCVSLNGDQSQRAEPHTGAFEYIFLFNWRSNIPLYCQTTVFYNLSKHAHAFTQREDGAAVVSRLVLLSL